MTLCFTISWPVFPGADHAAEDRVSCQGNRGAVRPAEYHPDGAAEPGPVRGVLPLLPYRLPLRTQNRREETVLLLL